MNKCFSFLVLLAILIATPELFAAEVFLNNGDRISGKLLSQDTKVSIETESMGVLVINRRFIDKVVTDIELQKKAMEEAEKAAAEKDVLSGEVTGGFTRKRGNTNETELFGEATAQLDWTDHIVKAKVKAFYGAENRRMNEQTRYAMGRYEMKLGEKKQLYGFGQVEVDTDRFANIDYRLVPTAGLGYWFKNTDEMKFKAEVGAGATKTEFRDDTEGTTEFTLTPSLYAEMKLYRGATISEELTVYPMLTDSEYRLVSETKFDAPILDNISFQFRIIDKYNSMPGADTKKNDIEMISSLSYKY